MILIDFLVCTTTDDSNNQPTDFLFINLVIIHKNKTPVDVQKARRL
jgi:hypothetical protein